MEVEAVDDEEDDGPRMSFYRLKERLGLTKRTVVTTGYAMVRLLREQ